MVKKQKVIKFEGPINHGDKVLSYSQIITFMDCRMMYYLRYILGYELMAFKPHNIVGNTVHFGIFKIYEKNPLFVKEAVKYMQEEKMKARSNLNVSPDQEKDLLEWEYAIKGMLQAYNQRYAPRIKKTEHKVNEFVAKLKLDDDTQIKIKIDNILIKAKKNYLHEIKTTKQLTPDYIKGIVNDLQTAIYFHVHNQVCDKEDKLAGIIYDVIRKPGIRLKKDEKPKKFMERLGNYYLDAATMHEKFHIDERDAPIISKDRVMNIINKVNRDIRLCKTVDDFYPNERYCYVYSRCEFYDLCHYGPNPSTLMLYKRKNWAKNQKQLGGK